MFIGKFSWGCFQKSLKHYFDKNLYYFYMEYALKVNGKECTNNVAVIKDKIIMNKTFLWRVGRVFVGCSWRKFSMSVEHVILYYNMTEYR